MQHLGRYREAAERLELARTLDTADRYINAKAVKYQLRAGLIEQADENAVLYSKVTAAG
jgi:peptide alpha-N-acetyltransferase